MTSPRVLAGRYRLDTEIGRGAMGTVWNAYDEVLRRRVAIKEVTFPAGMPPGEAEQLATRTMREARAIAALSHPHVITLFDILTPESGPVIVMELVVARSLAEILKQVGPIPDVDAAAIGQAVADGLMAAHSAGITHRDVKPANVLVADDGRIKLTDFGIARSAGEQTLTATGMLLGSPAYIAPEVAAGRPATPAADAWGLGALLYSAVEGHPPFDRGDPIATMTAVVRDPVPPHRRSGRLAPVIDALLVKDPQGRMPLAQVHARLAAIAGGALFLPPALRGEMAAGSGAGGFQAGSGAGRGPGPGGASPGGVGPERAGPGGAGPGGAKPVGALPGRALPGRASPPLPPPPWAAEAAARLPALPPDAPDTPRRSRIPLLLAALLVGLLAAAAGFAGVLALAHLA